MSTNGKSIPDLNAKVSCAQHRRKDTERLTPRPRGLEEDVNVLIACLSNKVLKVHIEADGASKTTILTISNREMVGSSNSIRLDHDHRVSLLVLKRDLSLGVKERKHVLVLDQLLIQELGIGDAEVDPIGGRNVPGGGPEAVQLLGVVDAGRGLAPDDDLGSLLSKVDSLVQVSRQIGVVGCGCANDATSLDSRDDCVVQGLHVEGSIGIPEAHRAKEEDKQCDEEEGGGGGKEQATENTRTEASLDADLTPILGIDFRRLEADMSDPGSVENHRSPNLMSD